MANSKPWLEVACSCGPCAFEEDEDFSIPSYWMRDLQNPLRPAEGIADAVVDAVEVTIDPIIGINIMVAPATRTLMMNDDDAAVEEKTMMIMGGSSLKRKASDTSTSSPTSSVVAVDGATAIDHQLSPSQATTATAATTTAESSPSGSSSSAGLFPPEDMAALVTTSNRVPESIERSVHPSQRSSCDSGGSSSGDDDDRRDKATSPLSLSTNNSTPSVIGLALPPSPIRLRRWGLLPVSSSMNHDHLDHQPINTNNNNSNNASAATSPPPWPWSVEISPQRQVQQQQQQQQPSSNTHRGSSSHCHQFSSLSFGDVDLKMLTGCIDKMDSSPKDSSLDNFNKDAVEAVNVTFLVNANDRIDHSSTITMMTAAATANESDSPCKEEYTKLLTSPKSPPPYFSGNDNSPLFKTPRLDMARSNSFTITPSRQNSSSNIMSMGDVDGGQVGNPHHHRDDSRVSFNKSPTSLHLGGDSLLKTPRQSPSLHRRDDSRTFNASPLSLHRRDDSRTTFNTSPTSLNLNLTDMYSSIDIDNFFDDLVANSEMSPHANTSDQGIVGSNIRPIQHQQLAMNSSTATSSSSPVLYHHARSNSLQMIKNDHTFLSGGLTSPLVEFEVDCPHHYGYYHPTNTPIQPFHVDYPSLTISSTAAVEAVDNRNCGDSSSPSRRSKKRVKRTTDDRPSSDPLPRRTKKANSTKSLPTPLELKSSSSFPPAFPQGSITPSKGTLEMYDNELYRKLRDAPIRPIISNLPLPLVPHDVKGNRLIVLHGTSESRDDHEIEDCVASKTYAFYKYLREIYPAFEGCIFLLPGLQQGGGGDSSRNEDSLGGTMNISKVGSFVLGHTPGMSKSEKVRVKNMPT